MPATAAMLPITIKHLSHSSRALLSDCSMKWAFKYVHRLPEDTGLPMKIGSANHAVLEAINKHIKDQKTTPDRAVFRKLAEDTVKLTLPPEQFKDVKPKSKADESMSADAFCEHNQQVTIRQLQDMSTIYIDRAVASFKEILAVEEGMTIDVDGIPYQMYLDVVIVTQSGLVKVLDFKTKGQGGGEPDILQLTGYSLGVPELVKRPVDGLEQWDFIKKAKPDLEVHAIDMARIGDYVRVLKDELKTAWSIVQNRTFTRNMRSMFCGPGKCGYYESCMNPVEFEKRRETTAEFHKDVVEGLEHRRG